MHHYRSVFNRSSIFHLVSIFSTQIPKNSPRKFKQKHTEDKKIHKLENQSSADRFMDIYELVIAEEEYLGSKSDISEQGC